MFLLDSETREELYEWGYADIYKWGGSSTQFSMVIWNPETQETFDLAFYTSHPSRDTPLARPITRQRYMPPPTKRPRADRKFKAEAQRMAALYQKKLLPLPSCRTARGSQGSHGAVDAKSAQPTSHERGN